MAEGHESHGGHSAAPYLVVGAALAGFTATSFLMNYGAHPDVGWWSLMVAFAVILAVAIVKAALVVFYFMHLKQDYAKVGFLIIPALILGCMMMFVLLPDTVQAWHDESHDARTGVEQPSDHPKAGH